MKPTVATTVASMRQEVQAARDGRLTVGLVPTMGALHAGHASLLRAARAQTEFVVATVFVNPTQFGPSEDLSRYPRPLERDLEICAAEQVDVVFVPEVAEIYPPGSCTWVEVQGLQDVLCGLSRPGHFRGVATVVLKLFNIVQADVAFFGQKDAQQARVIRQMVRDLMVPIRIEVCPIVREPDGLALSSRNQYLNPVERRHATVLHESLQLARAQADRGERDAAVIRQKMLARIQAAPGAVADYVALVSADTLEPIDRLQGEVLVAVAVRFGTTRLIDNLLLSVHTENRPEDPSLAQGSLS